MRRALVRFRLLLYHVFAFERGSERLLDICEERLPPHRAIDHARRRHPIPAQAGYEGKGFQCPCGTQPTRLGRQESLGSELWREGRMGTRMIRVSTSVEDTVSTVSTVGTPRRAPGGSDTRQDTCRRC
jgi:hypothetical protein